MASLTFPYADYDDDKSALLCIPIGAIPLYRRFYEMMQRRSSWADRESWWRGYQLAAEAEECLMSGCLDKLVESNNQIYRLLDRAYNGTAYVATPDPVDPVNNPPVITPAIADVPPTTALAPGLLARFERHLRLLDNLSTGRNYFLDVQNPGEPDLDNLVGLRETITALQGILNPGWFGIGGEPATLADVVNALRVGSDGDKDGLADAITQISAGVDAGTDVIDVVKSFFTAGVEVTGEAAILATLIASSVANAALAQTQNTLMLNILRALRGLNPTPDNILQALRGDEPASATRNVIDTQADLTALSALIDEVEPILLNISEQLV